MENAEIIGKRIRKIRKSKKLTQYELADQTGTTHTSISCWEKGKRYMNIYYLMRICKVLGISADYLLFGKEHEE